MCGTRGRTQGFTHVGPTFSLLGHISSPKPICCLKPARCWQPVTIATENQHGQVLLSGSLGRTMADCLSHCHSASMAHSRSSDHICGGKAQGRAAGSLPSMVSRFFQPLPSSFICEPQNSNESAIPGQSFNYLPVRLSADENANSLNQYMHTLTPSARGAQVPLASDGRWV